MSAILCRLRELAEGTARGCDPYGVGRDTVIVVLHDGQVYVYRDACPHLNTPMAWRKDAYLNVARDKIVCFAHGALFDIESGLCTLGPCLGECLEALPFYIDEEGFIRLDKNKGTSL